MSPDGPLVAAARAQPASRASVLQSRSHLASGGFSAQVGTTWSALARARRVRLAEIGQDVVAALVGAVLRSPTPRAAAAERRRVAVGPASDRGSGRQSGPAGTGVV